MLLQFSTKEEPSLRQKLENELFNFEKNWEVPALKQAFELAKKYQYFDVTMEYFSMVSCGPFDCKVHPKFSNC